MDSGSVKFVAEILGTDTGGNSFKSALMYKRNIIFFVKFYTRWQVTAFSTTHQRCIMLVRRNTFFITLFIILISPFLVSNLVWLARSVKNYRYYKFYWKRVCWPGNGFLLRCLVSRREGYVWFSEKNSILFTEEKQCLSVTGKPIPPMPA